MKKILIVLCAFLLVGCNSDENKIALEDKFYEDSGFIDITAKDVNELKDETYLMFTNNNFCAMQVPCEKIFYDFMEKYDIGMYFISFDEFKDTFLSETVKYAPSVLIVQNGEIIDFLDANVDDDYERYQDVDAFAKWVRSYIKLKK